MVPSARRPCGRCCGASALSRSRHGATSSRRCRPRPRRKSKAVICTSTQHASEITNALRLGALKGEMHMEELVKADSKLYAWLAMKQRGGNIVLPGPGTQQ